MFTIMLCLEARKKYCDSVILLCINTLKDLHFFSHVVFFQIEIGYFVHEINTICFRILKYFFFLSFF